MNTLVEVLEGADTRERLLKGKVLVGTFSQPSTVTFLRHLKKTELCDPRGIQHSAHRIDQYQAVCSQEIPTYQHIISNVEE